MKGTKGKIITITSTKGGVGKTIHTMNLAGIYHLLGYKTLVIDLDLYGGAIATYLNSNNDTTIFNLTEDLINNKYKDISDYYYSYNENIDIIAAPKDPRKANKIDTKYIPLILNNLVYKYDVVLIDTSHVLDDINITALDCSDTILYILTNDTFDLKNARSFITIMNDVGYSNYYTVLNESVFPGKNHYTLYEIRNIINANIDFTISKSMHIKNIDKYILQNEILILNKNLSIISQKELNKLKQYALTLIGKEEK